MADPSGSTGWVFDARGRTSSESKTINNPGGGTFVTSWTYDPADRVRQMTYPDGEAVRYNYNAQGLIDIVNGYAGTVQLLTQAQYNAFGQPTLRDLGSGPVLRQQYSYDPNSFRLATLKAGNAGPGYTNYQNLSYTYDNKGNVLTIADSATIITGTQTQRYGYDPVDRVITATVSGGTGGTYPQTSYTYSATGSITSFQGSALAYNDTAHKHGVTHVGGVQKYWYDANGNVTKRISGTQTITMAYDFENRLTNIGQGVAYTYTYDGDGKLVKMDIAGTKTALVGSYYEVCQVK